MKNNLELFVRLWVTFYRNQEGLVFGFLKDLFWVILLSSVRFIDTIMLTLKTLYVKFTGLWSGGSSDASPELKELLLAEFANIKKELANMQLNLDALTAEVARVQTVQASAVVLIKTIVAEVERLSEEIKNKADCPAPEPVDTSGLDALVAQLKGSTDTLAGAVADSADVKDDHEVVLNADNPEVPTVQVVMPEVLPPEVQVSVEQVVDTVDPTSTEPQLVVTVEPAAEGVVASEETVTDVIKTDEGLTDVTVAVDAAVQEATATEHGVDVLETVKEAFETIPAVDAAPEEVPAPEAPVEAAPEPVVEGEVAAEVAVEAPVEEKPAE